MKLIVDVPHSLYENLSTIKNESVAGKRIFECVKNGTPIKTGHWILTEEQNKEDVENGNRNYKCSECNHGDTHAKNQIVPYCWYCGVYMGGAE